MSERVTTLSIGPTQSYTLKQGPDYLDIQGRPIADGYEMTIRRKPRLARLGIWLRWHTWSRWRRKRVTL